MSDDTPPLIDTGHVFRWDLDKTYLRTDFDRLASLVKIAFEKAADKVNVPGAAALLRALTATPEGTPEAHVHFISGSPRQMAKVLRHKLELDGIRYHSLHLKPNLENLARGRFRAIKEQVGYKLPLLLEGRLPYAPNVTETLFGDDAESDAFIYSLYADLMAGAVSWEQVEAVLVACAVYPDTLAAARELQARLTPSDCVERVFINLDRRSSPSRFSRLSSRIVPIYNYWQAALCLAARGRLTPEGTLSVAVDLMERYEYSLARLRNSAEDLLRRGYLAPGELAQVAEAMAALEPAAEVSPLLAQLTRLAASPPPQQPAPPPAGTPDYLALLVEERAARAQAKAEDLATRRRRASDPEP